MPHTHWDGGPTCSHRTKKACDEAYADWQATQQVLLAVKVVRAGHVRGFKGDKSVTAQLVRYIAGEQADILNDDGNPHEGPWVVRLRAAIERLKAGDVPGYNLYTMPTQPAPG